MEIIKDIDTLRIKIERLGKESVGLIHTRGPLHEGHRTLIQAARKENFLVIVSNIVIPREFESIETYKRYPKESIQDKTLASLAGADFFFAPDIQEFEAVEPMVGIKLKDCLKDELKGKDRPGYYEEYLSTVIKLLNIVRPKKFYMSDKDLQKNYFTRLLLDQLYYNCELRILPVVREEDGLSIDVKNQFLKADERKQVAEFYKIFVKAKTAYEKGMVSSRKIKWHIENEMSKLYLCQLEFAEIVEPTRLRKIETIIDEAILMIGIKVGQVRICDYVRLTKGQES
ncbi:MAG: hypothetical protein E7231_13895 [Cellulosilyticum sp.]|nr:hypothetical protein [Cellulosilyticum sp.]